MLLHVIESGQHYSLAFQLWAVLGSGDRRNTICTRFGHPSELADGPLKHWSRKRKRALLRHSIRLEQRAISSSVPANTSSSCTVIALLFPDLAACLPLRCCYRCTLSNGKKWHFISLLSDPGQKMHTQ